MSTGPHLSLETAMELVASLDAGDLFLDYQPVIDLRSGVTVGVEALVRWRHPERGLLSPAAFVAQAQRSRLGPVITTFALRAAARQWLVWRAQGIDLQMSVNLAPDELSERFVVDEVHALAEEGFEPARLTIEVTERRIAGTRGVTDAILTLHRLGVLFSLDDFGTGHSSLERLHELRFDEVKIDRRFVRGLASRDRASHEIVRFTTELAHRLGIKVVAEGIEDPPEVDALRELGVELGQGFYLGRPGPPEAIAAGDGTGPDARSRLRHSVGHGDRDH